MSQRLDYRVLVAFSSLNDSMIVWFYINSEKNKKIKKKVFIKQRVLFPKEPTFDITQFTNFFIFVAVNMFYSSHGGELKLVREGACGASGETKSN